MSLKLFTSTITLLFLFISNFSYSQFFSGAEISYNHIGGNEYKLSVVFYYNCQGVQAPSTISIVCSSVTNPNYAFTATASKASNNVNEVNSSCNSMPTTCIGGNTYGVSAYLYETSTITLPPSPDWVFSYSCGCGSCQNDINGYTGGYTVRATLNNQIVTANSSPKFEKYAKAVMQKGDYQQFQNSVIEQDGDSLVFSFTAMMSNSYPLSYVNPYSPTQFLNGYCMIDAQNGDMKLKSNNNINSAYGIIVKEYREENGQYKLIGSTTRSMDLIVYTANNFVPQLSGMDTCLSCVFDTLTTTFNASIEAEAQSHFRINVLDTLVSAFGNNCELSWNQGIQDASFQLYHNNTDSAYGIISWAPQASDVRNQPYCFSVTVQDDACPYNARNTYRYYLTVIPSTVGIEEQKSESIIRISPNPVKNVITIAQEGILCAEFQIYSIDGRIIKRLKVGANVSTVDISELTSGIYIIRTVNSSFSQKFIKL